MVPVGSRGRRRARRVLGALALFGAAFAAFAVLVHHEAATAPSPSVRAMSHAMPGAGHAAEAAPAMGACSAPGAGHCAAPVVDPPTGAARAAADLDGRSGHRPPDTGGRPVPGPVSGRPPPDPPTLSPLRT